VHVGTPPSSQIGNADPSEVIDYLSIDLWRNEMAMTDVMRLLADVDTGNSVNKLDALGDALKRAAEAGQKFHFKDFQEAKKQIDEMGQAAQANLPAVGNHFDRVRKTTEEAGHAISYHLPASRKHVEEFGHTLHESIVKSLEPALGAEEQIKWLTLSYPDRSGRLPGSLHALCQPDRARAARSHQPYGP
jgi:hypothetical protein